MNKLIKRLAMLSVGLTMAIGAGIAAFGHGKGEVAKAAEGDVLYSADFTSVATHSYTQNKEFTLSSKSWVSSVSQVNSSVFYLGCNSGNASKGILNNNSEFADVVTAVASVDTAYNSGKNNAHCYALRFDNAYDTVGEVEFAWNGGNNAFQVYLFGDKGGGLELLEKTDYATSGASVAGFVKWSTEGSEDFTSFVIAARPGATDSTAASKTLRAATFTIKEGASGSLTDMAIFNAGGDGTPFNVDYGTDGISLYARETAEAAALDVEWSTSDATVLDIEEVGDHLVVKGLKPDTATVSAERDGYKKATATITVSAGDLETIVVTGSMSKTSYYVGEAWSHAGLVATANYELGYSYDATEDVEWTFNPAAPAENVTSVVATATMDEVSGSSAAQAVTVTVAHAGTAADPFTVAEAIAKCEEIGNVSGGKGPWVTTGIISQVVQVLTSGYQNARAYITADGKTTSPSVYVYDFKYLENAGFTEETAANIVVGATITVTGNLMNYNNNTPEYARGGYLLDIEAPETGDVDVTFNPASTSFEVGATGTFTASSETSGATFSWAVDDDTVLSVNESTGAYQALKTGVARVTVTASAGGKEGHTFVDFTVNGAAGSPLTVAEAVTLAASLDSGKTTSYYVYVEGYVKEFATSMKDSKPRAFDIMSGDEASRIMVYTNVDPYADFVSDLALGHYVKVKANVQNYSGTYELTNPEKISSAYSALSLAYELLSLTDEFCDGYDGVTDNKSLVVSAWETLSGATKYGSLSAAEIAKLVEADAKEESKGGTILEQAMARYDYLNDKYELEGFIEGRGGSGSVENRVEINNNNSLIVVIAVISAVSLVALSTLLVLKKKHK